ncbi:flagellin [uncultured Campylobacter sp.]|uniref:flagellin N-terminal helical domain-containing protein n=1 Tax=uncultured Campylobacter sp. TaxID=218934 RepID=UPI0026052AB5|nr:flagellin [uncultured Campylobacter sp.]
MRITNQLRFNQTLHDYQKNMAGVNKSYMQLSNGLKIQDPYDGAAVYNDAMRLDYEATTLTQVVDATGKSVNFAKNTDNALQSFEKQLENFKTKVVQAASDVHSTTSLEALANDLQGIKNHLVNIANTSINGQFLFSGSAVDTKPIDGSGKYQGNRDYMKTSAGAQVEIPYNIPGFDLFLGKDGDYNKILTTNVMLADQTRTDISYAPKYLDENSKIKNMIGLNYATDSVVGSDGSYKGTIEPDYDFLDTSNVNFPDTYFFMQGKKPDGTTFTSKFKMSADTSMAGLMEKIGMEFGNTKTTKVVDVSINNDGQFNIKDLTKGNQTIDFHMVAATSVAADRDTIAPSTALDTINSLKALERMADAVPKTIHITEFTKSKYLDKDGNLTNAFDYDKVRFERKDNELVANLPQVARKTGEYATDQTKLSEVSGTKESYNRNLYPRDVDARKRELFNIDGQEIGIQVKSITGTRYDITVKMGEAGGINTPVQFEIKSTTAAGVVTGPRTLSVYNSDEFGEYRTYASDFTYRQLMDIVAMAASDNIPNPPVGPENANFDTDAEKVDRKRNHDAYKEAIDKTRGAVEVNLDDRGRMVLTDKTKSVTNIEVTMYDAKNGDKFDGDSTGMNTAGVAGHAQGKGSVFSFNENNALTIDEPSTSVFQDLDDMIYAVRNGYYRADSENHDPRNTGMQGALKRLDHLIDHANKELTKIGSQTKLLTSTKERAEIMKVNVLSVKNDVIDADYAESYLKFTQLTLSYQATLQASAKINQLSLLNYLN